MYELSMYECERRLGLLRDILTEGRQRDPDFVCECSQKARARHGELLARSRAGDESGLDELLDYYRGCINAWAKDICPTAAARTCFKAELVATLQLRTHELTEAGFCNQLHDAATNVAIAQHTHILEWHQQRLAANPEEVPLEVLLAEPEPHENAPQQLTEAV